MLPNHAPLVIAEQFGTLEALVSGPHRSRPRPRARHRHADGARAAPRPRRRRRPVSRRTCWSCRPIFGPPAAGPADPRRARRGLKVPIWLLGSSLYQRAAGARCWACPSPSPRISRRRDMMQALELYRSRFEPSAQLDRPYAMLGVNVIAADTDARSARGCSPRCSRASSICAAAGRAGCRRRSTISTRFARRRNGRSSSRRWPARSSARPNGRRRACGFHRPRPRPDELIVSGQIFDHAARLRSFAIAAQVREFPRRANSGNRLATIGTRKEEKNGGED